MDGPRLSFRALSPIAKDEEIFISYIDETNPFIVRQWELASRYYFKCACLKCALGPTQREDELLVPLPDMRRTWATDIIYTSKPPIQEKVNASLRSSSNHNSEEARRLATIEFHHFDLLEQAKSVQDPAKRAIELENAIRQIKQSNFYAITRQPYAAARHEYLAALISAGEFAMAWMNAIKTYVEIDPILYLQQHHPLRMVHRCVAALLSLYIASEDSKGILNEIGEMGLDIGVLIYKLLSEAATNVDLSHGADSKFAKLVKAKFEEVKSDMLRARPDALGGMEDKIRLLDPVLKKVAAKVE